LLLLVRTYIIPQAKKGKNSEWKNRNKSIKHSEWKVENSDSKKVLPVHLG
jgi:hypothetical protein